MIMAEDGPNVSINGDIFFESQLVRKITGVVTFIFFMTVSLFKLSEKQL